MSLPGDDREKPNADGRADPDESGSAPEGSLARGAAPLRDEGRAAAPRVVALERSGYRDLWRKQL
jgi:hypothetical protein